MTYRSAEFPTEHNIIDDSNARAGYTIGMRNRYAIIVMAAIGVGYHIFNSPAFSHVPIVSRPSRFVCICVSMHVNIRLVQTALAALVLYIVIYLPSPSEHLPQNHG